LRPALELPTIKHMPNRSRKPSPDNNRAAFDAVAQLTGTMGAAELRSEAAKMLGSLGGRKGGPARAKALSAKRRKAIARKAARARWNPKG